MTFQETLSWVSRINKKLYAKGLSHTEVADYWDRITALIPTIAANGIEEIKVCTGCGHLNIEPINPPAMACCPDSNYINIQN